jgi:hypothetical protein
MGNGSISEFTIVVCVISFFVLCGMWIGYSQNPNPIFQFIGLICLFVFLLCLWGIVSDFLKIQRIKE